MSFVHCYDNVSKVISHVKNVLNGSVEHNINEEIFFGYNSCIYILVNNEYRKFSFEQLENYVSNEIKSKGCITIFEPSK